VKLGFFIILVTFYSFYTSGFLKLIISKEFFFVIDNSLNQSFLYDSPLSKSFFDFNRLAYNKPHFWVRSLFQQIALNWYIITPMLIFMYKKYVKK